MSAKISQEIKVRSSVYQCDNIMQGEARNPLIGMLPFSRYVLKPKVKSHDFGGGGLYACFFRDRLIYVGKYLGTKKDFRAGNIISMRWVKHIGSFTMMARNLSFSKKAVEQINQVLASQSDIVPQSILEAFSAVSFETIIRARDCVSTYARFDVAMHIWQELGFPTLDWLKEFSFMYAKIDTDLPRVEARTLVSQAENNAVSSLSPPGNSIRDRSWSTYSMNEVREIFTDCLLCQHMDASNDAFLSLDDLPKMTINEPEEEGISMEFEERIDNAPLFAQKFVDHVKQKFDSVDNASIEYTMRPDMRIRKIIEKGLGFVNAATIRWQPRKKRFLLGTALGQGEIGLFGLTVDRIEPNGPLPSVIYLYETTLDKKIDDILKCLKYAHEKHVHRGHR